ncbi:hypothetical protein SDC9_180333 [bioreactor metagenome]|uniref:Uncharacterized protein n=1 Tax=bioreactor metagenome TaxID=1076179 RepID=A0A645H2F2_9ZZZZ
MWRSTQDCGLRPGPGLLSSRPFQDSGTGESQIFRLQDAEDLTFRSFRIQTGCRCEIWVSLRQPSRRQTGRRPVRGPGLQHQVPGIMVGYRESLTRRAGGKPDARRELLLPALVFSTHRHKADTPSAAVGILAMLQESEQG